MNKPKFSIILGVYNQHLTVGQLASSLNDQTFKDFDVHFCDDGSDDQSEYVFKSVIDPRISVYYHRQAHRGMRLAKNLNQGIKEAQGEYCLFVMGDSFLDPQYLEVMAQFVTPERLLCGVRYQVDNGVGVDVDWRLKKNFIPPENVLLPSNPHVNTTGNGLLIPTEAMKLHGGWNERLENYGGDDYEVVARLYYKGYTVWSIVDAKLYHNWHIAKESDPANIEILKELIPKYAGSPLIKI